MNDDEDVTPEEFDVLWREGIPVTTVGPALPPQAGWHPTDFASVTVDTIPYTSNAQIRADPYMTVTPDGWLYIEVGTVRLALPDREEWSKFVHMGEALWNSYQLKNITTEGESDDDDSSATDDSGAGQPFGDSEPEPRGDLEASLQAGTEPGVPIGGTTPTL